MTVEPQQKIDQANQSFWNELCGSNQARTLGITDCTEASLKRFDNWYFDYYPYLEHHIGFADLSGKQVLEIGLGFGSVAQRIAESGAAYHGLDIALGPVEMVKHRLKQNNLPGDVRQGSILECPFANDTFDKLIAIGCFHHTGNLARAIAEARRVLKPGGTAMIMVYYAYSYRRWFQNPTSTIAYFLWDKLGIGGDPGASNSDRYAYDADSKGNAAPETTFVSNAQMKRLTKDWKSCEVYRENVDTCRGLWRLVSRKTLSRFLGPISGLDIYCELVK